MPRAFMPTEADLEVALRSLGLFDTDELSEVLQFLDLSIFADAAVRQWEEETGWIPFLADTSEESADQIRYYDPPGPNRRPQIQGGSYTLDLGAGIVILETVHTGFSPTSAGTAQVAGTDFNLLPHNADPLDRPWTQLEFTVPQWGARRSIKVVGRFGYASAVPEDAWVAILHQGVRMALPEVATRLTGGARKFTELGVTEEFGEGFLSGTGAFGASGDGSVGGAWGREWRDATRRYRRVTL